MKKNSNTNLRSKEPKLRTNEANWEELDCSKKLLILLKQGYILQYAGKGAFVAIKGDKRFFIRENVSKEDTPNEETVMVRKEVLNEENK